MRSFYSVRAITEWPNVRDAITGEERPATNQEMMDLGYFQITPDRFLSVGVFPDMRGTYKHESELLGVPLSGGLLHERYRDLPKEEKQALLQARVYRHKDADLSLRHLVNDNNDPERLRAGVPAVRGSAEPASREKADRALAAAKLMATAVNGQEAEVLALTVPMADVQDGDVVEVDLIPPMKFAGEPDQ